MRIYTGSLYNDTLCNTVDCLHDPVFIQVFEQWAEERNLYVGECSCLLRSMTRRMYDSNKQNEAFFDCKEGLEGYEDIWHVYKDLCERYYVAKVVKDMELFTVTTI